MDIITTPLEGLLLFKLKKFHDQRGYFFESYQQKRYQELGLPLFVQDNFSRSHENVLRGLHYQLPHAQGKLVSVIRGRVWDVAVDLRRHSVTFGQWFGILLDDEEQQQLYIPPGFAHGFCVLSTVADFHYKCTDFYTPTAEHGLLWNDEDLNIDWPIRDPMVATKDQQYPRLRDIPPSDLPE